MQVSVTRGGPDVMHGVRRGLYFEKDREEVWRSAVIRQLRNGYARTLPGMLPGLDHIRNERLWRRYLRPSKADTGKYTSRKNRGAWHRVKYPGCYLKRPLV